MAEETKETTEDIAIVPETEEKPVIEKMSVDVEKWNPKTELGKKVKKGEITDIGQVLDSGKRILEYEIIDVLLPGMETELLLIGQARGKFGGGQRRIFKQTQKKTKEGNKPHFTTVAVTGNKDGYIGLGSGKAKETVPAREKAYRNAKLNMIKIRRGCGSWQCGCKSSHSIPFKVIGKCSSITVELMPAPKGTGLMVEKECQKILKMAGITDVWSKTRGCTTSKLNVVNACFNALKKLTVIKIKPEYNETLGIVEGKK